MTDATLIDRMQLLALSPTQQLFFDASETQSFYIYTIASQSAQQVSSVAAQAFFNSGPSWTLPGITCWGLTNEPLINKGQSNG